MRTITLAVALLLAACAMAVAATAALAAPPEWGQCVPSPTHEGGFTGGHCTFKSPSSGAYEWRPEPSAKPGFSVTGEAISLETAGKRKITCAASVEEGKYTGPKTETTILTLIGCTTKIGTETVECRSNPAKEGEIESGELTGEIGFAQFNGKRVVALDLKSASPTSKAIFSFTCGTASTGKLITWTIEGSVLGRIAPLNGMVEEFKLVYAQVAPGKQQVQSFEGGEADTLTSSIMVGVEPAVSEATSLKMKALQAGEERAEIGTIA